MSRAVRIEFEGACYHIRSSGVARMPAFQDDDRRHFLDFVGELVDRGVLVVHAFQTTTICWYHPLGRDWHDGCDTSTETMCGGSTTLSPADRSSVTGAVQRDHSGECEIFHGVLQIHSSESKPVRSSQAPRMSAPECPPELGEDWDDGSRSDASCF